MLMAYDEASREMDVRISNVSYMNHVLYSNSYCWFIFFTVLHSRFKREIWNDAHNKIKQMVVFLSFHTYIKFCFINTT